jgi:3-oxoacyl-(acyl-carrier-protein) synthase
MDIFITGAGWITPLGAGLAEVWDAILAGAPPPLRELDGPPGHAPHVAASVPPALVEAVARNPRLRRSSNISLFAAAACLDALRDAGLDAASPGRCALIFAVSDGGVIYTRKFYDQVVRGGAGSPLLFPETVYNAPCSHVAALLGLDGITYTLVGDASVGLSAVALGVELLAGGQVDHCLVAGAAEADWVLVEAYRQWRLSAPAVRIGSNRGALIADGAAAIVLGREGACRLEAVSGGVPFFRRAAASASLAAALAQLPPLGSATRVISSANGTFVDRAESAALEAAGISVARAVFPKVSLGEAIGASALMQMVCAVESLRRDPYGKVLVPVIGLNHQASAALLATGG